MKASPFTALLSPHGQRRRRADGDSVAEIARKEGASEPTADPQRLVEHSSRGQSRIPELRGAHAAQCRTRHRPAAPPGAWVGLAAEPAEAGGRPPMEEPLLRGPVGGPDGGVVARAAPAGEGPPGIERLRQAADAGAREPAAAESEPAPIPSTAFAPPSGGCLPWANRPLRARRGRGGQAPNASPTRCESPRCARTGPARPPRARRGRASAPTSRCPCAAGARFPPGRLNGAGESGRTRKGRRPAPTPPNEMRFPSYGPMGSGSKKRGARRLRRAPRGSVVEPRGIEPLTSWLPAMRSPS